MTDRDLEILRFIGRYGFATAEVISGLFGLKIARVYRLLDRLRSGGLLTYKRPFREFAGAYCLTRKGCRTCGLPVMRELKLELVNYRHQLGVLQLGAEEESTSGSSVLTEREIRGRASFGETWSVPLPGPGSKVRWPDLVVVREHEIVAVELELAAKRSARLARIIDGYERQSTYSEVLFVIEQGAVAERIARIASGWRPGNSPNTVPARRIRIKPWHDSPDPERIRNAARMALKPPAQRSLWDLTHAAPTDQPIQGEIR